jgi:hypothetical protein
MLPVNSRRDSCTLTLLVWLVRFMEEVFARISERLIELLTCQIRVGYKRIFRKQDINKMKNEHPLEIPLFSLIFLGK